MGRLSVMILAATAVLAYNPCPLLGPAYPAPKTLSRSSTTLVQSWAHLQSKIGSYLSGDITGGVDRRAHSFSVGVFSTHDPGAQKTFQYHHSGTRITNLTDSANKADGDSIYRVASLSKLFTVYEVLIRLGSKSWDRPITDFVPELAVAANTSFPDPIRTVDWSKVTLGSLAGQISGLARDVSYSFTDLAVRYLPEHTDPTTLGLPPLDVSTSTDFPKCNFFQGPPCNESVFIQEVLKFAPTYVPWTTPIYSDPPFALLSFVLERLTGKAFGTLLQSDLFDPLDLTSTSYNTPKSLKNAIIPGGDSSAVFFNTDAGPEGPVYGIYSSLNDLNKLGASILNSTLLEPEETRQWLKPITHTANANLSVGRPWEIYRLWQPVTGRLGDLYTKDGNLGNYTSLTALSPDHGAGFNILVAGPQAQAVLPVLEDILAETLLPAFERQAAAEAAENFAGTYGCVDTETDVDSLISFAVDAASGPGLVLTSWINNGTDLMPLVASTYGIDELDARLYPAGLVDGGPRGAGEVVFRAVFGDRNAAPATGPFSGITGCNAWGAVDAIYYGGKALDQFIFVVDGEGRAVEVVVPSVRAQLVRREE